MFKYEVPFYANTPDDTHCYQAALRSILKYFLPEKEYTWSELEKMTAKKEGLWTWPTKGILSLHKMGFDIVDMDDFDIEKFMKSGKKYLIKKYGKEVADAQEKNSDLTQEIEIYKEYLQLKIHLKKLPSSRDIKELLDKGYLVICNINSDALNNKPGYTGHFVVVIGYDNNNLYLHDPGLPPLKDRRIDFKQFIKAWGYPDAKAKNLIGFRHKRQNKPLFVKPDNPILNLKAQEVEAESITSKEIQDTIEQLLTVAYGEQSDRKKPVLVGLAAPQVGISKRIILVDVGADGHGGVSDLRVYINPEITWMANDKEEWYEGCFSTDRVCGIVKRPVSITIKAYTDDDKQIEESYSGYTARIFQHEIDHLNGVEFVQYIKDDDKLHWVEEDEFPLYRDKEAWRNWPHKCPRGKWEKIKGIKKQVYPPEL